MTDSEENNELLREEPVPPTVEEGAAETAPVQQREESNAEATFNLFKTYLDKKLSSLKEEIADGTHKTTSAAVKKLKETEVTFKFEGNKKQYQFNCSLAEQVALAQRALKRKRTSQLDEVLGELEKQIKKRNKLIRLADKSPAGWGLINEYLSDELASGSEDEKRIKRAEQTALRKKTQKQKRPNRNYTGSQGPRFTNTTTATSSRTAHQTPQPYRYSTATSTTTRGPKTTDICFACGLAGHWRADCRRAQAAQTISTRTQSIGGNQ